MKDLLKEIYNDNIDSLSNDILNLVKRYHMDNKKTAFSEKDSILIVYGDSIYEENNLPLKTLSKFLNKYINKTIKTVHLLPFYPFSSDDGFSVINYLKINQTLGEWADIDNLAKKYSLMFDAVINHISQKSDWFLAYQKGVKEYDNFFIECNPLVDYSQVVRPRELPLYYQYDVKGATKYLWATFSKDQLDLNYKNKKVLLKVLEVLLQYSKRGAKYIRLDAIAFLWKEQGTSCIHLKETHLIIKLIRKVFEMCQLNTFLLTETNVPHQENIAYFGNGNDEAHLVYQFPLPPLTLFTFLKEDTTKLLNWVDSLNNTILTNETTYFNFLASHDGIGLRPVEGILNQEEIQLMANTTLKNEGKIGYKTNSDGSVSPYELNINYLDALCHKTMTIDQKVNKFMASQIILLSLKGIPGIYIHSLLGSRNDILGVEKSGINRRINREKLDYNELDKQLSNENTLRSKVLKEYLKLLEIRKNNSEFSPLSKQKVVFYHRKVFSIIRKQTDKDTFILVLVNVSNKKVTVTVPYVGINLLNHQRVSKSILLLPNEYMWIRVEESE